MKTISRRRSAAFAACSIFLGLVSVAFGTPAGPCTGDCNGDASVTVDEILVGVNIALTGTGSCAAIDADASGTVTVDEIVTAVGAALTGCPPPERRATVIYDRTNRRLTTPFPDDFWTVADDSKPTRRRVSVPIPDGPSDIRGIYRVLLRDTNTLDGFSPIAHFAIELSEQPDPASLPTTPAESLSPDASVLLFDVAEESEHFGQRIPFRIDVRNDRNVTNVLSHSLLIFPSIPLEPKGRYVLVVRRGVRTVDGTPFEPSTFFESVLADPADGEPTAVTAVRDLVRPSLLRLAEMSPPRVSIDDIALAVRFSVRSTDSITSDLLAIRKQVFGNAPPAFTIDTVEASSDPNIAAIVNGTWEAPDWRNGLYFRRDAEGRPQQTKINRIPFLLALPRAALDGPVPITMYQHGNPGSAQREVPGEARDYLGEAGFAVIGFTDNLNREVSAGSTGMTEAVTRQVTAIFFALVQNQHVPDFWVQLNGEQLAFLRMIQSMGTLDVLPVGAPDGIPDVDPGLPLTYVGISQGGNYAPGFLPYAPEIRSAAVMVGGARLAEVLIHQQPEAFLNQLGALYPSMTATDIWMAMSLFQTIYDQQDQHNHARFLYRAPVPIDGVTRKASILLVEGLNDSLVPNHATESLAWAMGPLPHLQPVQRAVPFLDVVQGPVTANIDEETTAAFYQYVPVGIEGIAATPGCTTLSATSSREGHYCAQSAEESERQRREFFRTTLENGVPTILDPLAGE